jgi:hypothetical protein
MRYFVRNAEGEELVVPSLGDLHALYAQGFLGDEDLVRSERSDRWVRAGAMPALHGVRLRRSDSRKLWLVVLAAAAFAAGVALLVAR